MIVKILFIYNKKINKIMKFMKLKIIILVITTICLPLNLLAICTKTKNNHTKSNIITSANDSKIKNYIYQEDKIYVLKLKVGFQAHITFAPNEEIQTISIGESYAFKKEIINKRLFIQALEENIKTNMTIITNERSYVFDVIVNKNNEDDSMYMVKFTYPKKIN